MGLLGSFQLSESVKSPKAETEPAGRVVFYNDFHYLLLGMVLERTTGGTVTQWLDKTLWEPLGAQYQGEFLLDSILGVSKRRTTGLLALQSTFSDWEYFISMAETGTAFS